MMKPTAIRVITARSPVVDEDALCKALLEGWIGGAALNVFREGAAAGGQPAAGRAG